MGELQGKALQRSSGVHRRLLNEEVRLPIKKLLISHEHFLNPDLGTPR